MNLGEFLLYLHQGAYDAAKQLFLKDLSAHDRAALRLVSRTFNHILLDYPLVNTLFVSTHEADLRWLEAVSDNDRLLAHITTVNWCHSAYDFSYLLQQEFFKKAFLTSTSDVLLSLIDGPFLDQERIDNAENPETKLHLQWAKLANQQYINLKLDRDYTIMRKVVRKLKGVGSVILSSTDQEVHGSPAWHQCQRLFHPGLDEMPRRFRRRWFSYSSRCWSDFPQLDHDLWRHLAFRGMEFFESLWCQKTDEPPPKDMRLRWGLPKLKGLSISRFPRSDLGWPNPPQEMIVLSEPIQGIEDLNLIVKLDFDCSPAIKSLLLSGSSSLVSLSILFNTYTYCRMGPELEYLCDIILSLKKLKELRFESRYAYYRDLVALGQCIHSHSQLRLLSLIKFDIVSQDENSLSVECWNNIMLHWRETQDLFRLEKFSIEGVRDSLSREDRFHPFSYASNSNTLEWLKGGAAGEPLDIVPKKRTRKV